jgi:hypothetical protein
LKAKPSNYADLTLRERIQRSEIVAQINLNDFQKGNGEEKKAKLVEAMEGAVDHMAILRKQQKQDAQEKFKRDKYEYEHHRVGLMLLSLAGKEIAKTDPRHCQFSVRETRKCFTQ